MIPVKDILKTLRTIINESATEEDSFTIETDEALKEFIRLALLALMNDEGDGRSFGNDRFILNLIRETS